MALDQEISTPTFKTDVAFCSACGALLPNLPETGDTVSCLACSYAANIESFASRETSYTIIFNKRENATKKRANEDGDDGRLGAAHIAGVPDVVLGQAGLGNTG